MRHDDSSNRPRVNPAQNPRLAAALGKVSLGIDESPDSRNASEQAVPKEKARTANLPPFRRTPIPMAPASPFAEAQAPAPLPEELYLPDNNEIELMAEDDAGQAWQTEPLAPLTPLAGEDEIMPQSGEFELYETAPSPLAQTPPPPSLERPHPSLRPGVIAYGTPLPAEEPAPADLNPIELDAPADLIPSEFDGNSIESEASGVDPGDMAEVEEAGEQSPWSKAAPPVLIDKRDLPSALSPDKAPEPSPPETPAESGEKGSGTRSFITLFMGIAVGASLVTFLLLYLGILHGPEGPPESNTAPIVVPPSKTAAQPDKAQTPPPTETAAPAETQAPVLESAAPSEPTAPSASASADMPPPSGDEAQKSTEPQTAASTPSEAGVSKAPVVGKPPGGTTTTKKKTRIF